MTVSYLTTTLTERHLLDAAGRDTDVAAVLEAARQLHIDGEALTEYQRWNLTRILGRNGPDVLTAIGDHLTQADRWADIAAGGCESTRRRPVRPRRTRHDVP